MRIRFSDHALEELARHRIDVSYEQDREVLEDEMKVRYDEETDTLRRVLRSTPVHESDEERPGVILDYDRDGNVVGIEILDASTRVDDPQRIKYLAGAAG